MYGPAWGWANEAVRTDQHGRFEITGLRPTSGKVSVAAFAEPGRDWAGRTEVRVGFGERLEGVVVTLDREVEQLRAQVVDADDGSPIAGCEPSTLGEDPKEQHRRGFWTHSDEEGWISLPVEAGGRVTKLDCRHHIEPDSLLQTAVDQPGADRFELHRGRTLHGVVVDQDTQLPVAGLHVALAIHDDEVRRVVSDTALTDAQGRFTIAGLAPRTYELDPEFGVTHLAVEIDDRPAQRHTFMIAQSGRIEVEVGAQELGRVVVLADCQSSSEPEIVAQVDVESDGLAVFEFVAPGEYRVTTDEHEEPCGEGGGIEVSLGSSETVRAQLEVDAAPGLLRVRTVGPDGAPVAAALYSTPLDAPTTSLEWADKTHPVGVTGSEGAASLRDVQGFGQLLIALRPGMFGVADYEGLDEVVIELRPIAR